MGFSQSRQVFERQVGAPVDPHPAEPVAFGLERLGAHRGQEPGERSATLGAARSPCPEGEPEEGKRGVLVVASTPAVLAVDDPRLVGVDPQADLPHPRGDRGQHVLGLPPALAVHDDIVGETLERAARELPGHPRIERVVHEQVRQDRRNRRPLRGSLVSLHKRAVRALQRRFQPPLDVQQHPAAVGDRLHRTNHELPGHGVEELLDVEIDHPVVLPAPLPAYPDRVVGRLLRAIAIGVRVEPRLHQRLQEHGCRRLRDPVGDRRYA